MSKQAIISVIEDVIGEYVQNMSKENLKVAMVRGKVTLDDVQLDGDLIGSHVLGAVGLSGFGILSCSARKLRITIPWGSLEKTPTKCEISGVHLVCVPLLPSNATRMCGAGTAADPRCTLRTRAKRSALARYERNFFAGRILGEGPMKNKNRKAELKRRTRAVRMSMESSGRSSPAAAAAASAAALETSGLAESSGEAPVTGIDEVPVQEEAGPDQKLGTTAEIRNALKMRLKAKAFRNIEAIIRQIHIRCEVVEGALRVDEGSASSDGTSGTDETCAGKKRARPDNRGWNENPAGRSFAFGCTLDSFVVKTATPDWETGERIFDDNKAGTGSVAGSGLGPLGGPTYKVVELNGVSMYWDDDDPEFLVSESDVLKKAHDIASNEVQKRIADAMEAMAAQQDPGENIRDSLTITAPPERKTAEGAEAANIDDTTSSPKKHDTCSSPFSLTFRATFSDPVQEGPSRWEAELLPFELNLSLTSHQYQQYQQLRNVMREQQRVDTMLHQRPERTAMSDPRSWWKYIIGRVLARPNARPWRDVHRIAKSRPRYIELVKKKILNSKNGNGFHSGLSGEESFELLALEDHLPIESLLSFHLLALRDAYHEQTTSGQDKEGEDALNSLLSKSGTPRKSRSGFKRITRKLTGRSGESVSAKGDEEEPEKPSDQNTTKFLVSTSVPSSYGYSLDDSLIQMTFIVRDMILSLCLLDPSSGRPFLRSKVQAEGSIYSCGVGVHVKEVALDLKNVDVDSFQESNSSRILSIGSQLNSQAEESSGSMLGSSAACRLMASRDVNSIALGVSARPATLVWNNNCFEKVASFISSPDDVQGLLRTKLRNAATPLAYKAQLAMLSPKALAVKMNIDAPKVWLPITSSSSQSSDGAIFFDAGLLKASLTKGEGVADTCLRGSISQINVKYCDRVSGFMLDKDGLVVPSLNKAAEDGTSTSKRDISVVRPFSIHIDATISGIQNRWDGSIASLVDQIDRGRGRCTTSSVAVSVGDIYLDLVDADLLAKAIGRLYAAEIIRVKRRAKVRSVSRKESDRHSLHSTTRVRYRKQEMLDSHSAPSDSVAFTVTLNKIGLALEGRALDCGMSKASDAPSPSFHERKYLLQLFGMRVHQVKLAEETLSRFTIKDASIIQSDVMRHQEVFGRAVTRVDMCYTDEQGGNDSALIRASLLRNGKENMNEFEIDVEPFVLVITPISLIDCVYGIAVIVELGELMTQEMERKIHNIGRSARERRNKRNQYSLKRDGSNGILPSPSESAVGASTEGTKTIDSTLLFRLTLNGATLLVSSSAGDEAPSAPARLQVVSNALVMFQSIENDDNDASGSKTLHMSLENLSATLEEEIRDHPGNHVADLDASSILEPFAAEFRIAYSTHKLGSVVSQDFAWHCDTIKSCMTLLQVRALQSIIQGISDTVSFSKGVGREGSRDPGKGKRMGVGSLIRYKKSGTGIATSLRAELLSLSFVLLRPQISAFGVSPLFNVKVEDLKGSLEGCMSALFGDVNAVFSITYFHAEVQEWEYVVEPFKLSMAVEQMPNELVVSATTSDDISANLTSVLLSEVAEMEFNFYGSSSHVRAAAKEEKAATVDRQQRSQLAGSIYLMNESGCDLIICPMSLITRTCRQLREIDDNTPGCIVIEAGRKFMLDNGQLDATPSFAVGLSTTVESLVGKRQALLDLTIDNSLDGSVSLHVLTPTSANRSTSTQRHEDASTRAGRNDGLYDIEPVVEYCVENQRLRSSVADVHSLSRGRDLLSSQTWSPGDECYAGRLPEQTLQRTSTPGSIPGNWTRPYLKDDCPEWTDTTSTLRMARERVMLPDENWIWASNWTVDISGECECGETDADGWEYATDFESFKRRRRSYRRGDTCRRRRWTRTRMIKPPKLNDPLRRIPLVLESGRQPDGTVAVKVSSPVTIINNTSDPLTIFLYSTSWEKEIAVGDALCREALHVPLILASAMFVRLARPRNNKFNDDALKSANRLENYYYSERVMIIPTGFESFSLRKATLLIDGDQRKRLHFNVHIQSTGGLTKICIEPVLQVVNLLPCQLSYRVGEKGKDSVAVVTRDQNDVDISDDSMCITVDPRFKPHMSIRLPGYDWSRWNLLVNRKSYGMTWLPTEEEEKHLFHTRREDAQHRDECKTIVELNRTQETGGDRINVVMSVETSLICPIVRFYAQYWILDKTGFGLRFAEGFDDVLRRNPSEKTSRRSHSFFQPDGDENARHLRKLLGHQWSVGMDGMTIYFSRKERLAVAIERGKPSGSLAIRSKWSDPMDVANVMPKSVFGLDECDGDGRFEFSLSVALCPSIFSRTKLISIVPRYQIVNFLEYSLCVAQDGRLDRRIRIPPQESAPFHWPTASLPPKVRLSSALNASSDEQEEEVENEWTNGSIELDKVGITSIRMKASGSEDGSKPEVIQIEVRLGSKTQTSAVVVIIYPADEKSNPLYLLRNMSSRTILTAQPLHVDGDIELTTKDDLGLLDTSKLNTEKSVLRRLHRKESSYGHLIRPKGGNILASLAGLDCGIISSCTSNSFDQAESREEYVWTVSRGNDLCFGFDDPEKPHILEWTCADGNSLVFEESQFNVGFINVDAMGSDSILTFPDGREVRCVVKAEQSAKVIEFVDVRHSEGNRTSLVRALQKRVIRHKNVLDEDTATSKNVTEDDDYVTLTLRVDLPGVCVSVVDNSSNAARGREILLLHMGSLNIEFGQSRRGYHELELRVISIQVDNHIRKSIHSVLLSCPRIDEREPFLHLSAVRKLQTHASTFIYPYIALRILPIEISLDRRTTETIARFFQPVRQIREEHAFSDPKEYISEITATMSRVYANPDSQVPLDIERGVLMANSGRVYIEKMILHPVRISLTFSQQSNGSNSASEGLFIVEFFRGLASITSAPLTFTSFVVGHAFESPHALTRILAAHYTSQLFQQIFAVLGSLEILTLPADLLGNVGTGVISFFYEPLQGLVHGPAQFIEGLETGTQSLIRGLFVGVVKSAANVTDIVNTNLAGLTIDNDFIGERNAHQKSLSDARSRGQAPKTFGDSFLLAGASLARSVKSGAIGIVQQPSKYTSKHGAAGFAKGMAKACVGAVVKPVVGLGDAAVLVMTHMTESTSDRASSAKIPKRTRRALPQMSLSKSKNVNLVPFDAQAANAQKIVTENETSDDVYIGHARTPTHFIIASENRLIAIAKGASDPNTDIWPWEDISHFETLEGAAALRINYFSPTGVKSHVLEAGSQATLSKLHHLVSLQAKKVVNSSNQHRPSAFCRNINQLDHSFGRCNVRRTSVDYTAKDEIDAIEQCSRRVRKLDSSSRTFWKGLDEEAWTLVDSFCHLVSGLRSRRCLVAGVINGTSSNLQIKSTNLLEGGSSCFSISTKEFDDDQGLLGPGGGILFFAWGLPPNLSQHGDIFLSIETNAFSVDLAEDKSIPTHTSPRSGYQVYFLEKSFDPSGWWAKFWLMCLEQGPSD